MKHLVAVTGEELRASIDCCIWLAREASDLALLWLPSPAAALGCAEYPEFYLLPGLSEEGEDGSVEGLGVVGLRAREEGQSAQMVHQQLDQGLRRRLLPVTTSRVECTCQSGRVL